MNGDLRLDAVMKSIDVYGRLAFGGQCVAVMAIIAAPLLFLTASILPFFLWDDSRAQALAVWLGGWAVAAGAGVGGVAFGLFCWRWSGDWITEWQGYAVAVAIGGAGIVALTLALTQTGLPIYVSFMLTIAAVFVAGFLVAGNLAGARLLPEQRRRRRVAGRRA
jgi:hypothetical protein